MLSRLGFADAPVWLKMLLLAIVMGLVGFLGGGPLAHLGIAVAIGGGVLVWLCMSDVLHDVDHFVKGPFYVGLFLGGYFLLASLYMPPLVAYIHVMLGAYLILVALYWLHLLGQLLGFFHKPKPAHA